MSLAGHVNFTSLRFNYGKYTGVVIQQPTLSIAQTRCHPVLPVPWQRSLLPRCKICSHSTRPQAAGTQSKTPLDNGSSRDQKTLALLAAGQKSTDTEPQPTIRQVMSSPNPRIEKGRPQFERLEVLKSGKEFRNQMLKDKGSWSHDWREALSDLEKNWTPNTSNTPSRTEVVEPSVRIPIPRNIRADKIKRPAQWTKSSFHKFVVQLAHSTVDRLVARQLYSDDITHSDAVADVIERVFAKPFTKYLITVDAGNVALGFLFKGTKFARGRDLFSRLQELQRNIHPSTYNIMLEGAADQKDLFTFTALLKMMISHGVRPDLHSWLHLAQAVRKDEVRMTIINRLIHKTATQEPAMFREAAAFILPQVASKHLASGKDPQSLIEVLDRSFRSEWLSSTACQQIIEEIGIRYSTPQALIILKYLSDRGYQSTQGMLLLLLRQCSWTRAHKLAIEILRLFRTEYAVPPSKQIYDVLFEQAWRARLYNCCRVLWIHACAMGQLSFNMQEKVRQSLYIERSQKFTSQARARFWEETAGKAITDCNRFHSGEDLWKLMSTWKPAQESFKDRDQFLRAARSILENDQSAFKHYSITNPLDELLEEALATDRRWAVGRALKKVPTECKCSQIIDVPLGVKISSKVALKSRSLPQPLDNVDLPVLAEDKSIASGRCWMSPEMRSRSCVCPDYVKAGLRTSSPDIPTTAPRIPQSEAIVPLETINSRVEEHQGQKKPAEASSISCIS